MALNVYAILGAAIILRCLLLSLSLNERYWIGSTIIGATNPFARPFTFLPGSDFAFVGRLTLADTTLVTAVILVPIGIIARPLRPRAPM
jgi:hypothetical protein